MKTAYKIVLINIALAIVITLFTLVGGGSYNSVSDTAVAFGLVCLGMSLFNFFIGLILLFTSKAEWGRGLLLSGAILLLLCGISCGSGFSGMHF